MKFQVGDRIVGTGGASGTGEIMETRPESETHKPCYKIKWNIRKHKIYWCDQDLIERNYRKVSPLEQVLD